MYTVVLLMLGYLLAMLDRTILPMMIVPVQRDLKISDTQFGLLQGFAFVIFYCVADCRWAGWSTAGHGATSLRGALRCGA